jgi:nicotinate-nucleotide--dimethylbenzimidazole phosphoribosyltransferase
MPEITRLVPKEKKAILNLDLRLGEGTGALLAMNFIEAGVSVLTQKTMFTEAGISIPHLHK